MFMSLGVISDVMLSFSPSQTVRASSTLQLKWPGLVTWNISAEHQMPWLLSMRTINSETAQREFRRPGNVKIIEWGPEILPTFLTECNFENVLLESYLSCHVCHISPCGLRSSVPCKDQFVHSGVYSSRKSTTEFEALPICERSIFKRRYGQFMHI